TVYRPKTKSHVSVELHVAEVVAEFIAQDKKSALVFLPGMKEIRRVQRLLAAKNWGASIVVAPLHASLSSAEQQLAISAAQEGIRKIVLSTNVAETSLTIEGITTVIDSGLARVPYFDQNKSISQLRTQMISQAAADQRKGRAGRLSPGKCYRLWSNELHHRLQKHEVPQILSDDLTPALLEANLWGEPNLNNLTLLDYPKDKSIDAARELLKELDAIRQNGQLSKRGILMARMGVAPRLAAMCLEGKKTQSTSLAASLAIILSEGNIPSEKRESDILLRLSAMSEPRNKHNFDDKSLHRLVKLSKQLYRRLESSRPFLLGAVENHEGLLLHAFPDRIAKKRIGTAGRYLIATGQEVQLHENDRLYGQSWLVVLDYGSQSTTNTSVTTPQVHLAAGLSDSHINGHIGVHAKSTVDTYWDEGKGAVIAVERLMLGAIVVREQQMIPDPDKIVDVILDYAKRCHLRCLDLTGFSEWRARVSWLKGHSDLAIECSSISELTVSVNQWLAPYVAGVRTLADLKKISLLPIILSRFEWGTRQRINQLAPLSITLPTGAQRMIQYREGGVAVVSVKIQELYGLTDTPAVNGGKSKLLLEMLSPASRPLQLTDDLQNFWRNTYPELCKEMKGRYPKHYWPESPETAQATNRTKKNMAR
ncbi:MAG: ATP-dependent helicase HrpB, partial [Oceanicoccus sp.]